MPTYRASITIDAPPDATFAHVAAIEGHGRWSADDLEITAVEAGTFRSRARAKGKEFTAELRVVESEPPSRFVFDAEDATGRWRHTFIVAPHGTGSRVTRVISGDLSIGQLLLFWAVVAPIKRPAARRSLARLKTLVEDAQAAS